MIPGAAAVTMRYENQGAHRGNLGGSPRALRGVNNEIDKTTHWTSLEGIAAAVQAVDDVILGALAPVFAQERSLGVAWDYVCALSPRVKANCWALAEAAGHAGWGRMQALLNRYAWDHDRVRELLPQLVGRWLACAPGDTAGPGLAIDETAALKKGEGTFAVSPQHAGCTGKVENCVTSVFTAYVTTAGTCWVDYCVYMPERWAADGVRRQKAGVPEDLAFATKPDQAAAQVRRLAAAGLGFGWVAGDEVYGRSSSLRAACTELGVTGVFIVPATFTITTPAQTTMTVAEAATGAVYERRPCGMGSKGPRLSDWALIATSDPNEVLMIRRLITRPDQLAFFICHASDPSRLRLPHLATIAGRRWPIEETFKTGKDVLGWDQSQARTYTGLHRHTVLTALAMLRQTAALTLHAPCPGNPQHDPAPPPAPAPPPVPAPPQPAPGVDPQACRIPLGDSPVPTRAGQPRPPDLGHIKLSVAEHRRLYALAQAKAAGLLSTAAEAFHLAWSRQRRRHQANARWHHYQRHLRQALDPC
jgi:SRSO17 transposase